MIDYKKLAGQLGVLPSVLMAVTKTESRGNGFQADKTPKKLFERHKFYQCLARTRGKPFADNIAHQYPDICNPQSGGYTKNEDERLARAVKIARDCALESTSWGAFQVLGSNWVDLGYPSLQAFINAHYTEDGQVDGFVRYIQVNGLVDELQRKDFAGFARGYNGPAYRKYDYDGKMTRYEAEFAAQGVNG